MRHFNNDIWDYSNSFIC